jgi:hypothetical protein
MPPKQIDKSVPAVCLTNQENENLITLIERGNCKVSLKIKTNSENKCHYSFEVAN